ncbi:MAG: ATP-binding protein [Christensenella sp.]|jgi:two-component system phosphate regulon sensor histidine kinase PhoR|nr:ATP-binding protein [Christensenella sp.]
MTARIFRSIFLVATAVLLACFILIFGMLYEHLGQQIQAELQTEAIYIAQGLAQSGMEYFNGLRGTNRITWVAADGTVLYDSDSEAAAMENHADREEIQEALTGGSGESTRYSTTFDERRIYFATRLSDGTVLRVSSAQHSVWVLIMGLLSPVIMIFVLAAILSGVLASALSKRILRPVNAIDLEHPEQSEVYEELSPLLSKIYNQNRVIDSQIEELQRKQAEFTAITENMSEGFLVIDDHTDLLSYNSGALRLLGAEAGLSRRSVLALNRSEGFRKAVELSLSGEHCEQLFEREGRYLQIIANPVYHEEHVAGAVLVILDITEKHARESMRREFTANVSHELKTPLTSISGTAEIIKNGFVKPEDIPHFAGNIYDEAQRLITLIGDIMRLSQLDEDSVPFEKGPVDLYELASSVLCRLEAAAGKRGISLTLSGEHATVNGVSQVLDEMVFNLCDNAVKYSRENGHVRVFVSEENGHVALRVEDDGIGIPAADQARVFERFYRVDKSHSKEIGGTGLGLSIVKHGAAFHNARVALESELGKGTTVTVTF